MTIAGNSILYRVSRIESLYNLRKGIIEWTSGNTYKYVLREVGGVSALFVGKTSADWSVDPASVGGPTNFNMSLVSGINWNVAHAPYYPVGQIVTAVDNRRYQMISANVVDPASATIGQWRDIAPKSFDEVLKKYELCYDADPAKFKSNGTPASGGTITSWINAGNIPSNFANIGAVTFTRSSPLYGNKPVFNMSAGGSLVAPLVASGQVTQVDTILVIGNFGVLTDNVRLFSAPDAGRIQAMYVNGVNLVAIGGTATGMTITNDTLPHVYALVCNGASSVMYRVGRSKVVNITTELGGFALGAQGAGALPSNATIARAVVLRGAVNMRELLTAAQNDYGLYP